MHFLKNTYSSLKQKGQQTEKNPLNVYLVVSILTQGEIYKEYQHYGGKKLIKAEGFPEENSRHGWDEH
jgi:hypothetical protein